MKITLQNLTSALYAQAHSQDMTLSMFLESQDPTPQGESLDAFERLMKEANILTKAVPSKNLFSSKVESFYRTNENKILFPEYISRTLVQAMTEYPIYKHLVAMRTPIDSNVYKASYLDMDDASNKKATETRRVTEAADLPVAKLKLGSSAIALYKYGRAVEASYEALRRMSLEMFEMHIKEIGTQASNNKVSEIIDVIKNGDGNGNAAPVIASSSLDATATTSITRDAWIKFLLKFYPNGCDTVVANIDGLLQILSVLYPKNELSSRMDELLTKGLNASTTLPQNLVSNVTLLYHPGIEKIGGKESIIGLNSKRAVEEIVEVGSTVNEADKFIKNQVELLTISENSGFRKIFKDSANALTIG